ncbi:MAG: NAD(P)/FAD-dependent oxidoreductase, partial [Actinomycetia bacterium]|nr:NAD(P)/FAD-dependent oxidoreductase [Actinomycetes bacterium]
MRITRRRFLQWGATGVVAASVAPVACSPGSRPEGGPSSAVVIGAGLSGLVTAHLLSQGSTQVTVLDAHGHAGGRVITDRWPNGQISEAGFEEFFEQDTYPDVWWLID